MRDIPEIEVPVKLRPANGHPGYYVVPLCPDVAATPSGELIDLRGVPIFYHPEGNGHWPYPCVEVADYGFLLVHRLIASTFCHCPGKFEDLVVNHKDGMKNNSQAKNLEWITRSENSIHAYRLGLRMDNHPLKVKNLLTDEIREFYSLNETARWLGVNQSKVSKYLLSERADPFEEKFVIAFADELFPPLLRENAGKVRNGKSKAVILRNAEGLRIYDSIGEAVKMTGSHLTAGGVMYHLRNAAGTDKWVELGGYAWKNLVDYTEPLDGIPRLSVKKTAMPLKADGTRVVRTPTPIRVLNLTTQETQEWPSCQAFAEAHGVKKNTLQKSMWTNNGRWNQFSIVYVNAA